MDTSGTGTYRSPLVRKQRFIGFNDPHNSKDHPKDLEIQQRLLDLGNAKRCYETSEGSEDALPVLLFKCADALHYHPEIYLPGFMEKGVWEFVVAVVMDASRGPEATNAALMLLNNVVFNNVKPPLDVSSGILERVFGLLQARCVDPRIASLVINNLLDRNGPLAEVFVANGFDGFIDMILERRKEDVHGLAVLVPMLSLRDLPMPLEKRIRIFEALPKMLEAHALWQFADSVDLLLDFPDREIVSRIYGPSGLYRDLCTVAVAHPSEHTLAALVHLIKKMPDEISITAIPYAQLASIARSDNSAVSILALKALRRFVRVGGSAAVTSLSEELIFGDIMDCASTLPYAFKVATAKFALTSMLSGTQDQRRALAALTLHHIALDMISAGELSLTRIFVRVVRELLRDPQALPFCLDLHDDLEATAASLSDEHVEKSQLLELVDAIRGASPC